MQFLLQFMSWVEGGRRIHYRVNALQGNFLGEFITEVSLVHMMCYVLFSSASISL